MKPLSLHSTIADVAKAAGVSPATVSQILNGKDHARQSTRNKVLRAIEKLDYQPNVNARNLRMSGIRLAAARRTSTIMFLTYHEGAYAAQLTFETDYLAGILGPIEQSGYTLAIGRVNGYESIVRLLHQANFDGIIFATRISSEFIRKFKKIYPLILLGSFIPGEEINCIYPDNHEGARQAVKHLYELGHRAIGFVSNEPRHPCFCERFTGYQAALKELGLDYNDAWVYWGGGVDAYLRLTPRPTAIFCSNDGIAKRVIEELPEKGINVPAEMSVVGFDDLELANHTRPPLTTIRVPRQEMGRIAAAHLIESIEGKFTGPMKIVLPVTLHARASTAPPAAKN